MKTTIAAATNANVVHLDGCAFRRAAERDIPLECLHGYAPCPSCDRCTCGGPRRLEEAMTAGAKALLLGLECAVTPRNVNVAIGTVRDLVEGRKSPTLHAHKAALAAYAAATSRWS